MEVVDEPGDVSGQRGTHPADIVPAAKVGSPSGVPRRTCTPASGPSHSQRWRRSRTPWFRLASSNQVMMPPSPKSGSRAPSHRNIARKGRKAPANA